MKRTIVAVLCVLCVSVVANAGVVLDEYDGSYSYRTWRSSFDGSTLTTVATETRSGQLMQQTDMGVDASGAPSTGDAVMSLTLKVNAANTISGLGQVMLSDAADHRWMFQFGDLPEASDEWVTITSTSSVREDGQGTAGGLFDWSTTKNYWLQWGGAYVPGDVIDVTFDQMAIESIPEPATMLLLGLGSLVSLRRRK